MERSAYLKKLSRIDPAAADKVQGCGTYGKLQLVTMPSGKRQLVGGACDSWLCPSCGPRKAAAAGRQLEAVVGHLTALEGIAPDRFVFGAVTMAKWHGTLEDRMELLSETLTAATNQRWWKRAVMGYEIAQDYSGTALAGIHGHWHLFLVMAPDADLEAFKHQLHAFFQKRIGSHLVNWGSPGERRWDAWLAPAMLTPTLYRDQHGQTWKASIEMAACNLKADKGGAYRNLYDRQLMDLAQIVPEMRSHDAIRRGGIIATTRKVLGLSSKLRKTIRQHGNLVEDIPPALWAQTSPEARRVFRQLVEDPNTPAGLISDLVYVAQRGLIGPTSWGMWVLEAATDPDPTGEYTAHAA